MKIREGFVLRRVADNHVVLPVGESSVSFNGMIKLNDSGALLWRTLEAGGDAEALADALCREYEVDKETALSDAREFLERLIAAGCITE